MEKFCKSLIRFSRRPTREVRIGQTRIGGGNPVVPQSMADCSTLDTECCAGQTARVHAAGCDIMRFTVQGPREAANLADIMGRLRERGLGGVGVVADIHFAPKVALLAAEHADKVRINPGNFGGPGENFTALLDKCRERAVALRIGVNHGSLATHIVEKWGDTPRGMVESAMEYLRVCVTSGFDQVVVSMKSSNVRVMVYAYRLLAATMAAEGMDFPLHLGVTEAGDGMEGRVKSAAGIGALMTDGLGDTIRVSLTEPPENEIPVANAIIEYFRGKAGHEELEPLDERAQYDAFEYSRRESDAVGNIGGGQTTLLRDELDGEAMAGVQDDRIAVLEAVTSNPAAEWRARVLNMTATGDRRPVILHRHYGETTREGLWIKAASDFGLPLMDGLADGIRITNDGDSISQDDICELSLAVLQATRVRMTRPEYIACPGCGRTLYDLRETLAAIKLRTSHLKGLKIGVMGCIVNGPGEMADADYGYVGDGPGKVSLYKGRQLVLRAIPQHEAIDALIGLIKENGDWLGEE